MKKNSYGQDICSCRTTSSKDKKKKKKKKWNVVLVR